MFALTSRHILDHFCPNPRILNLIGPHDKEARHYSGTSTRLVDDAGRSVLFTCRSPIPSDHATGLMRILGKPIRQYPRAVLADLLSAVF